MMSLKSSFEFNEEFDIKIFDQKNKIIHHTFIQKIYQQIIKKLNFVKNFCIDFVNFQNDDFAKINIHI